MNIKRFFNTPRQALLSSLCILGALAAVGAGSGLTAAAVAKASSIGAENAMNFAYLDAGVDPFLVDTAHSEFDFERGQFIYDVEFTVNGTEYDYWIKASDGTVIKKNHKIVSPSSLPTADASITLDEAKSAALSDAGLQASAATFTKTKLDTDDGVTLYEIDFYTDQMKYEYEIDAASGAIYSKKAEEIAAAPDRSTTTPSTPTDKETPTAAAPLSLDAAKEAALADAGVSASDATFTKASLEYDDGISVYDIEFYTSSHEYEYEIHAGDGTILEKSIDLSPRSSQASGTYIGIDQAKEIATEHAGFALSEITFSKAKLDDDDGRATYDIEFFKNGMEYEYEIDALSGAILEYDIDID